MEKLAGWLHMPQLASINLPGWFVPVVGVAAALPSAAAYIMASSHMLNPVRKGNPHQYFTFKNESLSRKHQGKSISIDVLQEAYFAGEVDVKGDLLETLCARHEYAKYVLSWRHFWFFCTQWVPELVTHSRIQDETQVRDHYDRGDDFYNWFLGPMMVYTSGICQNTGETLEEMQQRKLQIVSEKVLLGKGHRMLDIGCGWGTLAVHAAKQGADVTAVTLGRNQALWGLKQAESAGVMDHIKFLCMDYRDIPREKWDRITCLEMAEHVGVKNFSKFITQVNGMLEDDGIFFLQIAGLRHAWQFEDLIWGLFMAKYVFPGADASCPLWWVVNKLEDGGFEVQSVDNVGVHYSETIARWYDNWKRNRSQVVKTYGERWYRVWLWFLAWSAIVSSQGSATCYQIVAHKNLNAINRKRYWSRRLMA
jgi:cyclopropane fatty-acyl-phospholipid synthase-like methyltransferase